MIRTSDVRLGSNAGTLPGGLDRCRQPVRSFPWRQHESLALRKRNATGVTGALSSYGSSEFSASQKPAEPQFSVNLDVFKDLPRPDDVDGQKAWQGVLAGALVGTVLSLAVTSLKATFVAGVVAAGVSLVPKGDLDVSEKDRLGLPGVALTSAAVQGQKGLRGQANVRPRTTATVATASLGAALMVAAFAAKSLPIVLFGTASWITIQKEKFDLHRAVVEGRDFLRTKSLSAPGIAASLMLLQAKEAAVTLSSAVKDSMDATTISQGSAFSGASAGTLGAAPQPAMAGSAGLSGATRGGSVKASAGGSPQPPQNNDEDERASDKTPLQNVKGQNKEASASDLVSASPTTFEGRQESVLEGGKAAPQGPSSPLENIKGQNRDANASDLINGTGATFEGTKDFVLNGGKVAEQGPSSPLQNVKGENKDASASDLINGTGASFEGRKDSVLEGSRGKAPAGAGTPLQGLKGGNSGSSSRYAVRATSKDQSNDGLLDAVLEQAGAESGASTGRQGSAEQSSVLRLQTSAGAGKVLQAGGSSPLRPASAAAANRPHTLAPEKLVRTSESPKRTPSLLKGFGGDLASMVASFTGRGRTGGQGPQPANRPHTISPLKPIVASGDRQKPVPSLLKGFGVGSNAGRRPMPPVQKPSLQPAQQRPQVGFQQAPANSPHRVPQLKPVSSGAGGGAGTSPAQRQPVPSLLKGFGLGSLGTSAARRQPAASGVQPQQPQLNQPSSNRPHSIPSPQKLAAGKQTSAGSAAGSSPAQRKPIPNLMKGMGMASTAGRRPAAPRPQQKQPARQPQLQPARPPPTSNRPHNIPPPQKLSASLQAARPDSDRKPPVPSLMRGLGMPATRPPIERRREAPGQTPARVPPTSPARVQPKQPTPLEKQAATAAQAGAVVGAPKQQKRTAVERWLIAAGSGVVASLGGLVYQLVNGAQLADPLPTLLLACVFACMLLILVLVTFGKPKQPQPRVAPA